MLHRIDGVVLVKTGSLEETVTTLLRIGVGALPARDGDQIAISFYVRDYIQYEQIASEVSNATGVLEIRYASSATLVAHHLRLEALRELQHRRTNEPYDD